LGWLNSKKTSKLAGPTQTTIAETNKNSTLKLENVVDPLCSDLTEK